MSRNISNNTYEEPLAGLRSGCLVITEYAERLMGFYIENNRLLAASVIHFGNDEDHLGDIFVGRISKVIKNSNACFVEYEKGVNGFLPVPDMEKKKWKEGDLIPVQLVKEPIKTKPATLSDKLSLTSEKFVFTYGDSSGVGISKKIPAGKKAEMISWLEEKNLAQDSMIGTIVRTQAAELQKDEFIIEFAKKKNELFLILQKAEHACAFSKLYSNDSILNELFRTFKPLECKRVVTDSQNVYNALNEVCTGFEMDVNWYQDDSFSLCKLYKLDSLMSDALQNKVWLKSGANIIIEQMESLTAVDVNSGKGTLRKGSKDKEAEHRMEINLEAAKEIALQLRLRNISGMVIIDFINLDCEEDKNLLLRKMKEYTADDILPVSVVDFTALDLMELTRKKGMKSLREQMRTHS